MYSILKEPDESFDIKKEQREDRVKWLFYGITALMFVPLFFLQEQAWNRLVFVLSLTTLSYGHAFYVDERENLRKKWLWKAVLTTIPLHALFLAGLFWWAWSYPASAHMGFVFAFVLLAAAVVEIVLMKSITDRYRPQGTAERVNEFETHDRRVS